MKQYLWANKGKLITAAVLILVALNGVFRWTEDGFWTQIVAALSVLGVWVVPPPVQLPGKEPRDA